MHHYSHHKYKHNISLFWKIFSFILLPGLIISLAANYIFLNHSNTFSFYNLFENTDLLYILNAALHTIYRLFIAYFLALLVGVPLAMLAVKNEKLEEFLLPIFDVLESVPVLVFFPVVIIFFININMLNLAAIFILS